LSFPWLMTIWSAACELHWSSGEASAEYQMVFGFGLYAFLAAAILTNILGYCADHFHFMTPRASVLPSLPQAGSHARCDGQPLRKFARGTWQWAAASVLIPLVFVATLASLFVTAFSISLVGDISGTELQPARGFSLVSFGFQELGSSSDPGARFLQAAYVFTVLGAPLLLTGLLLLVWLVPLNPRCQNALVWTCHALDAWVTLDVFASVVALASLDFERITKYAAANGAMSESCTWIRRQQGPDACGGVRVELTLGFGLLAFAAVAAYAVPKAVLAACLEAAERRDEVHARSRAALALAAVAPGLGCEVSRS